MAVRLSLTNCHSNYSPNADIHVIAKPVLHVIAKPCKGCGNLLNYSLYVLITTFAFFKPLDEASRIICPGTSDEDTIAVIMPLNTFI